MLPLEENYFLLGYPSPFLEGTRYAKKKKKRQTKKQKQKQKKQKKQKRTTVSHENVSLLSVSTPLDYIYIICAENFFSLGVTDFWRIIKMHLAVI